MRDAAEARDTSPPLSRLSSSQLDSRLFSFNLSLTPHVNAPSPPRLQPHHGSSQPHGSLRPHGPRWWSRRRRRHGTHVQHERASLTSSSPLSFLAYALADLLLDALHMGH